VCARACAVKKNREGWKNESADDDGGGRWGRAEREAGGSGFCARDDKFGGQRFAPRKPIAINTRYVRCAVEPPRYTLMQCIWSNL